MAERKTTSTKTNDGRRQANKKLLDNLLQQQVCAAVTLGCSRKTAAEFIGRRLDVIRRTALRHPQFATQLAKAEAMCEVSALTQLGKAVKDERNWRAVIWLLERRYPERYGRRKPRTASPQQIADVMRQFIEIVSTEVTDTDDRERIVGRLQSLIEGLNETDGSTGVP